MRIIRKKNAGGCGFNENVRFKNIERLYMLFLFSFLAQKEFTSSLDL